MRIRLPFAGAFFVLLVIAGYAGLTTLQLGGIVNDKVLHFVTFFLLTIVFYWIVDTNRRRTLNMALVVCTFGLGVGSELLQAALPNNGRVFDSFDILANIVGSLAGLALCSWYHKRMIERKRLRKYTAVPGADGEDGLVEDDPERDIELGETVGTRSAAVGDGTTASTAAAAPTVSAAATTTTTTTTTAPPASRAKTLEEEVDNWDENAQDEWDEEDGDIGEASTSILKSKAADMKKD